LRMANSVYFNPSAQRVNSLQVAVLKLGVDGLRAVLSAAVMQPIVQRKSNYFSQFGRKLWEHSLTCAVTCETVARARGVEPYNAYLLGLTHEVGNITLFSELSKLLQQNTTETPSPAVFIPAMIENAASLSATIAMDWELPKEVVTALQQQIDLVAGNNIGVLGHTLCQANLFCEAYLLQKQYPEANLDLGILAQQLAFPNALPAELDKLVIEV
jgi:HD-like signal output (HDOD) protein